MKYIPTYIGGLTASWTAMNTKTKFKPSKESALILLCTMGFLLGWVIGIEIISYFIFK